jgi:pyruvate decarboxylase
VAIVFFLFLFSGTIDNAISMCLARRKPVYLEISCNIATQGICKPSIVSRFSMICCCSDQTALSTALHNVSEAVNNVQDVVVIVGSKVNSHSLCQQVNDILEKMKCAVTVMPDGKGRVNEQSDYFVGTYWGNISSGYSQEIVEKADLVILIGPTLNDYTTCGWTTNFLAERTIIIAPDHIHFLNQERFSFVFMKDFLEQFMNYIPEKSYSFLRYQELQKQGKGKRNGKFPSSKNQLSLDYLKAKLQENISEYSHVVVDTGDSWFMGQSLQLPSYTRYHVQMQYGSIGWSLPAALGIALSIKETNHNVGTTLVLIGDGAFQVTVQELSTVIKEEVNVTIVILNNESYVMEQSIHPGPYNEVVNWDYIGLVNCMKGKGDIGKQAMGIKAATPHDLDNALSYAVHHDGITVVECCIPKNEASEELKTWSTLVAKLNARN